MIEIRAPHLYIPKYDDITVFLAGGITGCYDWQRKVIDELYRIVPEDDEQIVVYNPRQEKFDINNSFAANDQITWEFQYLNNVDIFSMYFVGGDQIQPICMYELGRYTALSRRRRLKQVISIEDGYARTADVINQVALATDGETNVWCYATPETHALKIKDAVLTEKQRRKINKGEIYS